MRILDSHVHFFDSSRPEGIDWPARDSPLYGTRLSADLISAMSHDQLCGCIAIETSRRPEDDQWLLQLSAADKFVNGIVLNLQPDDPGFPQRLATASESGKFLGVRLRPIDHYDLSDTTLRRSFALLEQRGKTIEFGAKSLDKKQEFADLARQFPSTSWVLDHCGHPGQSNHLDDDWLAGVARISEQPNTVAKVTGLDFSTIAARKVLDKLTELFGVERLLYGSNWPVSTKTDSCVEQISIFRDFFGDESAGFFVTNAERAYGLSRQT